MENNIKKTIHNNYLRVLEQIDNAISKSNRQASDIKLVVVTKAQPIEKVIAVIEEGATRLGENYPEEAVSKIEEVHACSLNVEWHMIGHLQSRKIKFVVNDYFCFHALDSLRLADKLERQLLDANKTLKVLLEFNVSGEQSKYGWPAWEKSQWSRLVDEIHQITKLPHLQIVGCMTMPPVASDVENSRRYFILLRELSEYLKEIFPGNYWGELSMGTSSDFEIAIQEGATYIRIGSAILGERVYNKEN